MELVSLVQRQTLEFIHMYYMANGYPPSIQDIASDRSVACNAIQGRIVSLQNHNYITKKAGVARSILLTDKGKDQIVPVVKRSIINLR